MHNQSKVVLPAWFWETAENREQLKQMIKGYISKLYPGYTVLKVEGNIAICEINR